MDKITYLAELAEGLARWVPERERQDILRYYAEYFEEAGAEREAEVVAELGDPWALSCRLAVEGGFVTQEKANAWTPRRNRRKLWPLVLAGTLAAVVITGVSVASFASRIGRFVGNIARNQVIGEATVVESVDYGVVYPGGESVPYSEAAEVTGGFWSMEDGWLEPFYSIDADISMGNITVTGGEDFTLAIQQGIDLGGYTVTWEIQGDTLKIKDGSSGGDHIGLDGLEDLIGMGGLDVIITVPEGACLQKIEAKTDLGNVFLSSMYVEEKVTAETRMGNVEGYELWTADKIKLETGMGNVTLGTSELDVGVKIELETGMGDVHADLACYKEDCAYELKTGLGEVAINGANQGSTSKGTGNTLYKLDAKSGLGNVDVFFYDSEWQ